ncbi:unnamed protein product [Phytomonas sp. EM1]|nr:unnamed protein product [Phytomonas sp. EM1]|eukprot:CCW60520.1 unnamed protein product [Phytomonas sp. isolate EM1]
MGHIVAPSEIILRQKTTRWRTTQSKKGSFRCTCESVCVAHDTKAVSEFHSKRPVGAEGGLPCVTANQINFAHTVRPYTTKHSGSEDRSQLRLLQALPSDAIGNSANEGGIKTRASSAKGFMKSLSGSNSDTLATPSRILHSEPLPAPISHSLNEGLPQKSVRDTRKTSVTTYDTLPKKNLGQTGAPIGLGKSRRPVITTPSKKLSCRSSFQKPVISLSKQNSVQGAGACKVNERAALVPCKLSKSPQSGGSTTQANDGKDCLSEIAHSSLLGNSQSVPHEPPRVECVSTTDNNEKIPKDVAKVGNIRESSDEQEKSNNTPMMSITYESHKRGGNNYASPFSTELYCASGIVEILPLNNSTSDLGLISTSGSHMRWVCKQEDAIEKKELQQFAARYYKRIQLSLGRLGRRCSAPDESNRCGEDAPRASGSPVCSPDQRLLAACTALRLPVFVTAAGTTPTASRSRRSFGMPKTLYGRSPSLLS